MTATEAPGDFAGLVPGAGLCAALEPVEPGAMPDSALLEMLSAEWRQLAYQQARV